MTALAREIIIVMLCARLAAQWVNHATANIPRTVEGKTNLTAAAPRTADGKPDDSGVWSKISQYGRNIAADLPPGAIQPWAEALVRQRREDLGKDHMSVLCLPLGPGYMTTGGSTAAGMMKIVQTPGLIVMLNPDLT